MSASLTAPHSLSRSRAHKKKADCWREKPKSVCWQIGDEDWKQGDNLKKAIALRKFEIFSDESGKKA